MWRQVVGLNPDDTQPGWKRFTVAPRPGGGVTWAKGEYQSIRGRIACDWRIEADKIKLRVSIPPNTTAEVRVPTSRPNDVTESGRPARKTKGVKALRAEPQAAVCELGSGEYLFEAPYSGSLTAPK
jgi:alpha-L-rhamnosidase